MPRYRLALVVGRGTPVEDWAAIDTAAAAAPAAAWPFGEEPLPWFFVRVLVADAAVAATMDASTLAHWAGLTGRAGPASRDTYWFAESWERFGEPDRRAGHITPAAVARSRRRRLPLPEPSAFQDATYGNAAQALNPLTEQGVTVPPGYCLIDCAGTLELAVVRA
jgi:hypothetical protein